MIQKKAEAKDRAKATKFTTSSASVTSYTSVTETITNLLREDPKNLNTLSGFAIFLGFGSEDFKRFLSKDKKPDESLYISASAAFIVFVGFQTVALLFALSAKGLYFPTPGILLPLLEVIEYGNYVCGAAGYFLFIYSISLSLRAALRIFRIARWYNIYLNVPHGKEKLRERRRKRRGAVRLKQ